MKIFKRKKKKNDETNDRTERAQNDPLACERTGSAICFLLRHQVLSDREIQDGGLNSAKHGADNRHNIVENREK